ncbi:hypothetical protein [Streptomyces sp. NBC_00212]|uniref:hypothetical protein n=1 Tax=Streptomyces sp. NBC_00212 TaxID=2975684 RepID=UPI003252988B
MTHHPLFQAGLKRMAQNPDSQGSGYSADCVTPGCGWKFEITADYVEVHTALEDHVLETGHIFFNMVVTSISVVDVPGVQKQRREANSPAGRSST